MTETGNPEALLWLDLETTGIDRDTDKPLEIGIKCTDTNADNTYGELHRIILPADFNPDTLDPYVHDMHANSGLLDELANADPRNDGEAAVGNAVEEFLESLAQRFTLTPAGTNVDFDLAFLTRRLCPNPPLSYRKFDVTALRKFAAWHGLNPKPGHKHPHRVRECLERDINEYRQLSKRLLDGHAA